MIHKKIDKKVDFQRPILIQQLVIRILDKQLKNILALAVHYYLYRIKAKGAFLNKARRQLATCSLLGKLRHKGSDLIMRKFVNIRLKT